MFPILVDIGPIRIDTYPALISLGFLVAIWWVHRRVRASGLAYDRVLDVEIAAFVGGLLGARLFFVLVEWDSFSRDPLAALAIWRGGFAYYGGLLGGLGCAVSCALWRGLPLGPAADLFAPAVALGQVVGRCACTGYGCCYGVPTDLPWGMAFPATAGDAVPRHPTQVYIGLLCLVTFVVLEALERTGRSAGRRFFWYIYIYATGRFFIEYLRADYTAAWLFAGLTASQVLGVGLIAGAAVLHVRAAWLGARGRA